MITLIEKLTACEALLRSVGENFWADKIQDILNKIKEDIDYFYLIEKIQSWYGGMGSFNDLLISKHNDHILNGRDENKINEDLTRLRNEIYQEVQLLKK